MHRLPSKMAIFRFRMAALLLWGKCLVFIVAFGVLMYAGMIRSTEMIQMAIGLFVLSILLTVTQWIFALQTKCPLCITPVLAPKNCSKNKKVKTFLGSYRLRVANSILFRNHFRCPYCSEPTSMEVRSRRPRMPTRD